MPKATATKSGPGTATLRLGEVAERLNVLAWKASRGDKPLEGSNPSLSDGFTSIHAISKWGDDASRFQRQITFQRRDRGARAKSRSSRALVPRASNPPRRRLDAARGRALREARSS